MLVPKPVPTGAVIAGAIVAHRQDPVEPMEVVTDRDLSGPTIRESMLQGIDHELGEIGATLTETWRQQPRWTRLLRLWEAPKAPRLTGSRDIPRSFGAIASGPDGLQPKSRKARPNFIRPRVRRWASVPATATI
jgi:hypothetical protein